MNRLRHYAFGPASFSAALWLACQPASPREEVPGSPAAADGGSRADSGTSPGSDVSDAGAGPAPVIRDAGEMEVDNDPFFGGSPEDSGPYATEQERLTLDVGAASSRVSTELTLVYPREAESAPVVLFHPGFQLPADAYLSYGEHLASYGILVVLVDPPDSILGGPSHAEMASHLSDILAWLGEQNQNARFPFSVDESRVGLAGHSMGGKISMLFASQDLRPVAVAGIDPVDTAGGPFSEPDEDNPSVTPERMSQITVPILLIGETLNGTCDGVFCQPCAPVADNFQQYFEHATSPALEIEVVGANHISFLDDPDCGFACSVCPAGTDDPVLTRTLTQRYLNAFFQLHLFDASAARTWLVGDRMDDDIAANRVQTRSKNGF